MMAQLIAGLIGLAIVNERVNILLAQALGEKLTGQAKLIMSLITGSIIAFAYNADITQMIGLKATIPYIGVALTGIIIGGGSNYLYDAVGRLTNGMKKDKQYEFKDITKSGE